MIAEVSRIFAERFGGPPEKVVVAPGRINLLGEHTDYNHGLALPAAIDRGIGLGLRRRDDDRVRIYAVDLDESLELALGAPPSLADSPAADWRRYVLGALAVFPARPTSGFEAVFTGDIPRGSGLSSSAALLVAWMLALQEVARSGETGVVLSGLDLCRLCQRVEHEHLGVKCGLLDPIGSLLPDCVPRGVRGGPEGTTRTRALLDAQRPAGNGASGDAMIKKHSVPRGVRGGPEGTTRTRALLDAQRPAGNGASGDAMIKKHSGPLLVDFADLSIRPVPADLPGLSWVVLHTGIHRTLAGSAYGDRVAECAAGLAAIQARHPAVRTVRDITAEQLPMIADLDGGVPMRRLRHVISENDRVRAAVVALSTGDAPALGRLLLATHASLRDDYAVSCPELDTLVTLAAAHPACLGGRMMGGGFGGCTVNLVRTDGAEALVASVLADYRRRFSGLGQGFVVRLGGGARVHPVA